MEKKTVLEAKKIRKVFKKNKTEIEVLKGVDFKISEKEMVAITGSSGVGKSTLLHILGTLETPTEGEVFFGSPPKNLFQLNEKKISEFRNRSLGFIFQFHYLLPEFSALENVMMPALIAGHGKRAASDQAKQLLDFVGLAHRLNHRPAELSGGEQQRVAIARAVILRPQLILADELTGNLDSENGEKILNLLIELNRSTNVSILLVTHDMVLAARMHRVLVMKDGLIV